MKDEKEKTLNEKELEEVNGGHGEYGLGKFEFKKRVLTDPSSSPRDKTSKTDDPYPTRAPK